MVSNEKICREFLSGNFAKSANLSTNGQDLFSYKLRIAGKNKKTGEVEVFGYTAKDGDFISQTTSRHVGLIRRVLKSCN